MSAYRKSAPLLAFRPPVILLLSTLLYFYPALTGGVLLKSIFTNGYYQVFSQETYLVVAYILFLLFLFVYISRNKVVRIDKSKLSFGGAIAFSFLWLPLLVYVLSTPSLFSANKHEVLEATNRFHLVFIFSSVIAIIVGASTFGPSSRFVFVLGAIGVLLFVYIGHRSYIAFSILGVIYVTFRNKSLSKIKVRYLFMIALSYLALVLYKNFYIAIKYGDIRMISDIFFRREAADMITTGSEQFLIFSQLDMVIRHNYSLECSNLLVTPFTIIPFTNELIDAVKCSFNSQIQPRFYSHFSGGVAANIWAEFYANFGLLGPPVFIILALILVSALEFLLSKSRDPFLNAGIIVAIIQLLFYTQRNEFLTSFSFAKRAIIIGAILMIASFAFRALLRTTSRIPCSSRGARRG